MLTCFVRTVPLSLGCALSGALLVGCTLASLAPTPQDLLAPKPQVAAPVVSEQESPTAAVATEPKELPAPAVLKDSELLDLLLRELALGDVASEPTDLWTRLRGGFAVPDLDNKLVRQRERWYAARPDYVARMTERARRYLFHIVEEVERRGMPTELALLPFIESAFNPTALSRAKASGMWQFMAATGKAFSLKQNIFRDDRRAVLASTNAALDYLSRLHTQFGDWHLALAAYNWGEGSVQRAIARNHRRGKPTGYKNLKMPRETRHYVPKFQAIKNIVAQPDNFGLSLPELANHPYFLSVPIDRDIDVELAASFADVAVEEFKALNPQFKKPVILAAGTPQVLLPYDNANRFAHRMAMHRSPLATWTAWVAPKTMKVSQVAKRVGMTAAELRKVNRIPPRMRVKARSTLLVRRSGHRQADVSERIADTAKMVLTPERRPLRRLVIKARKNDSVKSVARRYRVSTARVARWNKVRTSAKFATGQKVVVYTRGKPVRSTPKRATGKRVKRSVQSSANDRGVRVAMDR